MSRIISKIKIGAINQMFRIKIDFNPKRNRFDKAILLLLIVSFILRIAWLDQPKGSLIFDETYYVNAARVILKLPYDQNVYSNVPLGLDPNKEHPPLGKLIIAFSISSLPFFSPSSSSIIPPADIVASGQAIFFPAYFGADP